MRTWVSRSGRVQVQLLISVADGQQLFIPALAALYERLSPWSYPLMRFATGTILVPHGLQKIFFSNVDRYTQNIAGHGLPFAEVLSHLVFFTESLAAVCVAIGLFTRVAAAMIAVQMAVIVFVFQWPNGYYWTDRGYEYPLLLGVLCLAVVFRGGGRLSVDRVIGREF